jgi:hypothetical protein
MAVRVKAIAQEKRAAKAKAAARVKATVQVIVAVKAKATAAQSSCKGIETIYRF